ncbi:short-chain dehydrogenase, partial [Acinetobacter baumannii]
NSTEKFEKLFTTTADKAAEIIIRGVEKNQRRVLVGTDAKVLDLMVRLLPSTYQKLVAFSSKRMK